MFHLRNAVRPICPSILDGRGRRGRTLGLGRKGHQMTDDTNTAIQALIQQVSKLTETVDAQAKRLDNLHDFNGRILNEKKDLQRRLQSDKSKDAEREMAAMGYARGDDGNWYPTGVRPEHSLTRAEARDPSKYRAAKEAAAKAGATLTIIDPDARQDAHRRPRPDIANTKTTLLRDEDHRVAYVRRDAMSDTRQYQRLRADGFTVQSWNAPGDLPQHMQTKLALMEKAANEADS